jgi:hypothetical protein
MTYEGRDWVGSTLSEENIRVLQLTNFGQRPSRPVLRRPSQTLYTVYHPNMSLNRRGVLCPVLINLNINQLCLRSLVTLTESFKTPQGSF